MKYILNDTLKEPAVRLYLKEVTVDSQSEVQLLGEDKNGSTWLVASFTYDGHFQPNGAGARHVGLIPDDKYFKL